jgi:anaerobic selenocysteine-containing dehydrogenase
MNSSFANMPRQQAAMGGPVLRMHPADAAARALADGDSVLIEADDHQVEASLEIDADIVPGVI